MKVTYNSKDGIRNNGWIFKAEYSKDETQAVKLLLASVATDKNRYPLLKVFIDTDRKCLVSTDARRMVVMGFTEVNEAGDIFDRMSKRDRIFDFVHDTKNRTVYFGIKLVLKTFNFDLIAKGVKTDVEEDILNSETLVVDFKNKTIWNNTHYSDFVGTFPDYTMAIPENQDACFSFNADTVNNFVKDYKIKKDTFIKFYLNENKVESEAGILSQIVSADCPFTTDNMTDMKWSFSVDYLKHLKGNVTFDCMGNNHMKAITCKVCDSALYIMMPVNN